MRISDWSSDVCSSDLKLVDRVVERNPVDMVEIEEDDIGLVAFLDAADLALEAERPRAALGGGGEDLPGGQPVSNIRAAHLGDQRGQPPRLVHVMVIGEIGAIGADAHIDVAPNPANHTTTGRTV